MRERYLCMRQLQEQLMQLFEICEVECDFMKVTPLPAPFLWLERLVQDNQLYNYLENLTNLSAQAAEKMKEMKLEAWNGRQNERQIDTLYDQLEAQKEQLAQAEQARLQLVQEKKELFAQLYKEQEKTVSGIITLRDNLLIKKDWLTSTAPDDVMAAKLIDSQLAETARLLEDMGVEILQDTGAFDSRCHTAVGTRPADDPQQIDRIAETFRPGYRFRGNTLRSQEVIVYSNP